MSFQTRPSAFIKIRNKKAENRKVGNRKIRNMKMEDMKTGRTGDSFS